MSGRAAEPVEIPPACPFLAFEDDREHRSTAPDHRHRCHAETRPAPRAIAHQERYCLTSDFPSCPTFQAWARREAARETLPDEPRQVPAGSPPADPARWLVDDAGMAAAGGAAAATGGAAAAARATAGGKSGAGATSVAGAGTRAAAPGDGPAQLGAFDANDGEAAAVASAGDDEIAALVAGRSRGRASGANDLAASADPPGDPSDTPAFLAGRSGKKGTRAASARSGSSVPSSAAEGTRLGAQDPEAPAWERPRRFEAYPTLRNRTNLANVPPVAVVLVALVLAAILLFILPGIFLPGATGPGGSGSTTPSSSAGLSGSPTPLASPTPLVYVVRAGDTMTSIARKFGLTIADLLAANPQIKDQNKIKIGDKITIPTGSAPSESASGSP